MKIDCVIDSFEKQVSLTPGKLAVVCGDEKFSYLELNQKVNVIAHYLIERGVARGKFVGVILPRSIDFLVVIMAILKAGGCYVPIDSSFPLRRMKDIIDDAELSVLVTSEDIVDMFADIKTDILNVDAIENLVKVPRKHNPDLVLRSDDPIYVIYTSGSTGAPKGAINIHGGFANLVEWYVSDFCMSENDRVLIYTALSFDLTQKNIFAPFSVGATLFLLEDVPYNPDLIVKKIYDAKITWINSTPSAFYPLIENERDLKRLSSLRYVFVGGEPLFGERVAPIKESNSGLNIVNTYGPTECSDVCSFYLLEDKDFKSQSSCLPIGGPIKNVSLYVVDEQNQKVSKGEIGELCIGGVGVGLGYLNNRDLTKKSFLFNPFSGEEGGVMYKTGDLVRFLPDSSIEFIERKDFQVKIRGYRVELEEILSALKKNSGVKDALVVAYENQEREKYLVGYVVREKKGDRQLQESELRNYLENMLPFYMIPASIIVIDRFPLTSNGKIDRKNLPVPAYSPSCSLDHTLGEKESKLLSIWGELLPVPVTDVKDNFFLLGGHSLSAVKLLFRIKKEFSTDISIQELFSHPTILALTKLIEKKRNNYVEKTGMADIKKGTITGNRYPLSFPHQRLVYIENTFKNPIIFNNLVTLSLYGELIEKKLQKAFSCLIKRHDIFRTCVVTENSKSCEKIFDTFEFRLEKVDFSFDDDKTQQEKVEALAHQCVSKPFNLRQLPLMRGYLVRLSSSCHVLIMCLHQFLIDGTSMDIFYSELAHFYNNKIPYLEPLQIQYKDYAAWQGRELTESKLSKQIDFWRRELEDAPEQICLRLDKPRSEEFSYRGNIHTVFLFSHIFDKIKIFCKENDVTLFMVLLSAYIILLSRYTKNRDIVVGAPIANRRQPELEGLIGFFVNLVPYRVKLRSKMNFSELVSNIKEIALAAYSNQDVPFMNFPEYLHIERKKAYHPVFQVVFAMQPYGVEKLKLEGITVKDLDYEEPIAKFDITLNASVKREGIELKFEYAEDLFRQKTIETMAQEFSLILEEGFFNPKKYLSFAS